MSPAASASRMTYIRALCASRVIEPIWSERIAKDLTNGMEESAASRLITWLYAQPRHPSGQVVRPTYDTGVTPGLYAVEDKFYRVRAARVSGRLYAEVADLTAEGSQRFTFARGGIFEVIDNGVRVTVEEAGKMGLTLGWCLGCGRELSDAASLERGIGPVCAAKQAGLSA